MTDVAEFTSIKECPHADPLTTVRRWGLTVVAGGATGKGMNELLVGYARVSTEQQDLTAQRDGRQALGVDDDRIYVDHGLPAGTNRDRPGLRLALAACRAATPFVATKLDRLARSG